MSKLLVRPRIHPDEWWDGYVARALAENGYSSRHAYMLGRLNAVVGELVNSDRRLQHQAGSVAALSVRLFRTHLLPDWALRGSLAACAICPACCEEDRYVRLNWRLRGATCCHKHSLKLSSTCWGCLRPIFHWDVARGRCRCGSSLTSGEGWVVSGAAEVDLLLSLQWDPDLLASSASFATVPRVRAGSDGAGAALRDGLNLSLYVFVTYALTSLAAVRVVGMPDGLSSAGGLAKHLSVDFRRGVSAVSELWSKLPTAVHQRAALALVCKLRHDERLHPTLLSMLPLWEWAQELASTGEVPALVVRRGWIKAGELTSGLVSLKQAARDAGLSAMHLHHLMVNGAVVPVKTTSMGEKLHLFSQAQIESLKAHRSSGYGYGHSLPLGLPKQRLDLLKRARVVQTIVDQYGREWLDPEQLRALLADLLREARPASTSHQMLFNLGSDLIWQPRHLPSLALVLDRLRRRELDLWAGEPRPGFERFYVGIDTVTSLFRHSRVRGRLASSETKQLELQEVAGDAVDVSPGLVPGRVPASRRRKMAPSVCEQRALWEEP